MTKATIDWNNSEIKSNFQKLVDNIKKNNKAVNTVFTRPQINDNSSEILKRLSKGLRKNVTCDFDASSADYTFKS
ncbi:hypothetical protein DICPUDRAFT_146757 [Dictyostelium purpureum]|uniref:Uncharacterized protein n=1 Tax=Dictyostelium purpureum TaxID=5786 RepID=F0Z6N6_DICPU|nr:uncharacterized protein DICPUDRAFT_146757 [Dictyostelium purpureum]EGC40390.1 hypothetical protein DICPUDRAFT_146757 [Dictyostelium purpureum]|eukprot:XP_003283141.1 hypothetical protein DICPUDRAFT_146757 [Dictyostelium purpureum]